MPDSKGAGNKKEGTPDAAVNKAFNKAVKKVRPYPFPATIELGTVKKNVDIVFVGQTGFIATLGSQFVNVGDHFQVVFELPVLKQFVNTPVRCLKTYDKTVDIKAHKVERMAEFHFLKLIDEHRARIVKFMSAIGQTK